MKDKKPLEWIPIYIDKHIFGSTRLELEPDERSVWMDLLVLSGKDKGHVRANIGVPYPYEQLAGMLVISVELLERTIKKCTSKEVEKIEILEDKTMYIPSWEEYKLSPRHKRRFEPMSAEEDMESESEDAIERDKEKDIDKEKEKKEKKISFNYQIKNFVNIKHEDMARWEEGFNLVDIELELKKMVNWLLANPTRRYKNHHSFIIRWLGREQDKLKRQESLKGKDPEWMKRAKEDKKK